jgi:diacylglycerol kinase family enzyme
VQRLADLLTVQDFETEVISEVDQLEQRSDEYQQSGSLRAVVAAGGDGTVALVANTTPIGTPISTMPLGTENLLSKYLGLTANPEDVCQTVCAGTPLRLDAGEAGGRLFLLMAGCGFDADVVRRLHLERRGNIRHLAYAKPILDSIRNYDYPELRVYCENASGQLGEPLSARWVFVVNLPKYARGLQIVPDARGDDGLLDVCTFRRGSFLNGIRYLGGVILGRHRSFRDCRTVRSRRLRIESDKPVPFQLDGDPGGTLPVDIRVLPQRLTLLIPAA